MNKSEFLLYIDSVFRPCEALINLVPDDKLDYAPVEGMFTLGQLINHLSMSPGFLAKGIGKGEWSAKSMREIFLANRRTPSIAKEAALKQFHESVQSVHELIGALSEEDYRNKEIDTPMLGRVQIWRACIHIAEHQLNHKEQLFLYLNLLGLKVHTGTLYMGKL